jgi:ubiquinone/menaquinone biosynthesis C-methylase UbiE
MKKIIFYGICVLAALVFFWAVVLKIMIRIGRLFGYCAPCPASWSWIVDNPVRRRYMKNLLENIGIREGENVLELGPGPGVFTIEAAKRAGSKGSLTAVDIQPEMIAQVNEKINKTGTGNVKTYVASAYEIPLLDKSIDRAYLVTVLTEIPDQDRALAEVRRVLKPGGVISITEEFLDPDYPFAFETIRRLDKHGFRYESRFGNFWIYTLNFRKL